uniref:Uncharacterized protein n=1 Tax=Rhizophora mucronata TaxID=61149 RepID=A0A2P2NPE4_RHIMU
MQATNMIKPLQSSYANIDKYHNKVNQQHDQYFPKWPH